MAIKKNCEVNGKMSYKKRVLIVCIYIEAIQIFQDSQKRNNKQLNWDEHGQNYLRSRGVHGHP